MDNHRSLKKLIENAPNGTIMLGEFFLRALNGDCYAQFLLGDSYERGELVARNKAEAFYWFTVSAENGLELARNIIKSTAYKLAPGSHLVTERGLKPMISLGGRIRSHETDKRLAMGLREPICRLARVLLAHALTLTCEHDPTHGPAQPTERARHPLE